jgi:hypothetical protein
MASWPSPVPNKGLVRHEAKLLCFARILVEQTALAYAGLAAQDDGGSAVGGDVRDVFGRLIPGKVAICSGLPMAGRTTTKANSAKAKKKKNAKECRQHLGTVPWIQQASARPSRRGARDSRRLRASASAAFCSSSLASACTR